MSIDKQQKPVLFEILYLIIPAFLLFSFVLDWCPHVVRYDTRTGCACSHACSLSECFRVYACACACSCVYTCASVCLSFFPSLRERGWGVYLSVSFCLALSVSVYGFLSPSHCSHALRSPSSILVYLGSCVSNCCPSTVKGTSVACILRYI